MQWVEQFIAIFSEVPHEEQKQYLQNGNHSDGATEWMPHQAEQSGQPL